MVGKVISSIIGAVCGIGASDLISGAARMVADYNKCSKIEKVIMSLGAGACGYMVGEKIEEYFDAKIKKIHERIEARANER